jgi:hypothetical protein
MWLASEGERYSSRNEGSDRWDDDSCRNLLMEMTALVVDMEPFMTQAVTQKNNKQASKNKMHKKGMVDIAKMKKENKSGLVVAWWEAHKPTTMTQAPKTIK